MFDRHTFTLCQVCNRAIYRWFDEPLFGPAQSIWAQGHWTHSRPPDDRHDAVPKRGVLDNIGA